VEVPEGGIEETSKGSECTVNEREPEETTCPISDDQVATSQKRLDRAVRLHLYG
jgi:hypothetical protein